jgi:hypothetical protein
MKNTCLFVLFILTGACVKERNIQPISNGDIKLFVNEIVSSGSTLINEYGVAGVDFLHDAIKALSLHKVSKMPTSYF